MNKCYYRIFWKNFPDESTPLDECDLNRGDMAIDELDNRVIMLDYTKLDKSEANLLVKYIEYDEDTGIFKITHYNGASYTIDTLLEKLAINFDYDYQTQRLIIELSNGEIKHVDLSALITQYEFLDSETIAFSVDDDGKVTAIVKEGSIEKKHLQPNYLADIKAEVAKAEANKTAAATSEVNAKASENAAKNSEDNAAAYAMAAAESVVAATQKAEYVENSAVAAKASENGAEAAKEVAEESKNSAEESKNAAGTYAANALDSASTATTKAEESKGYADLSKSYTKGTGGEVRENDNSDCAEYYYNQIKNASQSLNGMIPKGNISFDDLSDPDNQHVGYFFNISDSFVSDERFVDGGGIFYGAGNNVLYTVDGKWDVTAASMVSGVKGDKETEYRQGFVNFTPGNIGALPENETAVDSQKWNGKNMVVISESDFQNLEEKDENTVYFRYKE